MINPNQPDYSNHPASPKRISYPYAANSRSKIIVSILTPFYNTDEVFLETAYCIFGQSFQEWEWIIVDDGSTDQKSLTRLATVEKMDSRVHIFHQPNRGPAAARNTAFFLSNGHYICLLDSDDLIEPTFIEKTVWFLESQPAFAFCNTWSVAIGQQEFLWATGFESGKAHLEANSGPPHSMIRRNAYQDVNGFDESIRLGHEDWDFWLSLADAGYWGYTLPEYLEWYRRRESGRYTQVINSAKTHEEFKKFLKNKYTGLEKRFPSPQLRSHYTYELIQTHIPFENRLAKLDHIQRILLLIQESSTSKSRINLELMKKIKNKDHQISICVTHEAHHELYCEFNELTPDVFILPNFLNTTDFPRFLTYLIQSRQINTVLISNCFLGYHFLPYLRSCNPKVVFVDLISVESPQDSSYLRFGVGYQDLLDLNLVISQNLREWMIGSGAEPDRIEICYTGANTNPINFSAEKRQEAKYELGFTQDIPCIAFVGRLCHQKRPLLAVEVLRRLAERGLHFRCLIIGDGELRPSIQKRIRQWGLRDKVTLTGVMEHNASIRMLAAADILFMPSLDEGISPIIYEAMAMGMVPVVAVTDGHSEILSSRHGFLVEQGPNEIEIYTNALAQLLTDQGQLTTMAAANQRQITENFTLEHSARRLLAAMAHAYELAYTLPRQAPPYRLALELATQAIEYARLQASPTPPLLTRLLAKARRYRAGRWIVNSHLVQKSGKWLLRNFREWRS